MSNLNREVWEGWTVKDFIDELSMTLGMIQNGNSLHEPITTKVELKKWCMENQPYYKKHIPEVVSYFSLMYKL